MGLGRFQLVGQFLFGVWLRRQCLLLEMGFAWGWVARSVGGLLLASLFWLVSVTPLSVSGVLLIGWVSWIAVGVGLWACFELTLLITSGGG